ncbi:hypothetical protein DL769_010783 [Monosporascus sp. CRB-8-3]|nr:hypothetical protein DL769_010783 [Monosporascus sp. CRB-8-3]
MTASARPNGTNGVHGNYPPLGHSSQAWAYPDPHKAAANGTNGTNGQHHRFCDYGVWREAPVLTGTTKFEPLPDVKNIMITGAQSHVDLSFGNSYGFTHTNVYGTHVMLESAKKVGVKRFIHVSTDEVYGEVKEDDDDLLETSILAPTNPYAASKAAAEMLVNSYMKSFKLPAIIVRSNNVYGPHQFPEKIIPKFTCLLNRKRPMVLHGDGTHTRRYLYAGDAADAFDTILHKGTLGQIYNVGSYDEVSNLDLCRLLLKELRIPNENTQDFNKWVKYTQDRPFNDHRYAVDGTKLRQLGWKQKTSFAEGLRTTVDWYTRFGEEWWGDITKVLSPFPIVVQAGIVADKEEICDEPHSAKKRKISA